VGAPATGTINNGTGTISYTITPPAVQLGEIRVNPFMEKTSQLTFTVTNGVSSETKSVTLRQIAYNLVTDVPATYPLDDLDNPQNNTITVYSNFPWEVSSVTDNDGILLNKDYLITITKEANTGVGNPLPITLQPESLNASRTGRMATITLRNRMDDSSWDIPVTILESLYVGMFGGELTNTGGVWQFKKALYIQNTDESMSIAWSTNAEELQGGTDYMRGKANTWTLYNNSYNNPAATRCIDKNGTVTNEMASNYRWYLPAQKQLQAAWVSLNSFHAAYRPSDVYLSSSEGADVYSWRVNFSVDGNTFNFIKTNVARVRCAREV
jgi:hypothetical protein